MNDQLLLVMIRIKLEQYW